MLLLALIAIALAFTLSAAAGLGGSLILVPALALLFGSREGIALAAVLLAFNNVGKLIVYRRSIPLGPAAGVLACTALGAWAGARLMVALPEVWVAGAIIAGVAGSFLFEKLRQTRVPRRAAPILALFSGATSGFSGTSGPLKGMALRSLGLDRLYFVGAASAVSLAGDAVKAATFARSSLFTGEMELTFLLALPLIPFAVLLGRSINRRLGERAYAGMFWTVMLGYALRLAWS